MPASMDRYSKSFGFILIVAVTAVAAERNRNSLDAEENDFDLLGSTFQDEGSYLPNCDYLFRGYNVIYGNPVLVVPEKGHDPGISRLPIFKTSYNDTKRGKLTALGEEWLIPDGTQWEHSSNCDASMDFNEFKSEKEYTHSMTKSLGISGGYEGFEFQANKNYKENTEKLRNSESVFVRVTAQCSQYQGHLNDHEPPELHPTFVKAARELGKDPSDASMMQFFKDFGSHFIFDINMGSKMGIESEFTSKTYQQMKNENHEIKLTAKLSGLFEVGITSTKNKEEREKFENYRASKMSTSYGANIPEDGDEKEWASKTRDNPLPISLNIKPVHELFTNNYMKKSDNVPYEILQGKLKSFLGRYCGLMYNAGEAEKCDAPLSKEDMGADQPLRIFSNKTVVRFPGTRRNDLAKRYVDPQNFPDKTYFFRGYNIFAGEPVQPTSSQGHDPGISRLQIFEINYDEKRLTSDRRFFIPDGTVFESSVACRVDFGSETMTSEKSLQKSTELAIEVSGGYGGLSFKANRDYQKKISKLRNSESVYVKSQASCSVYSGHLNQYFPPKFSKAFLIQAERLSADISYDNMRNLLEDFGTHYTTDVVMGARFGVMNEFTKKGYENAVETGLNVGASATYSGLFEAGVSYSKEVHSKSRKKFEELRKNYKIYSYGSRIPTSGNSSIWASESSKTPLPISLKMRTIADLFTDKWLWNSWTTTNRYPYKIDYKKIRPHLMRFLFSHCQLLIDNEKIKECYLKSLSGPAFLTDGPRLESIFRSKIPFPQVFGLDMFNEETFVVTGTLATRGDFRVKIATKVKKVIQETWEFNPMRMGHKPLLVAACPDQKHQGKFFYSTFLHVGSIIWPERKASTVWMFKTGGDRYSKTIAMDRLRQIPNEVVHMLVHIEKPTGDVFLAVKEKGLVSVYRYPKLCFSQGVKGATKELIGSFKGSDQMWKAGFFPLKEDIFVFKSPDYKKIMVVKFTAGKGKVIQMVTLPNRVASVARADNDDVIVTTFGNDRICKSTELMEWDAKTERLSDPPIVLLTHHKMSMANWPACRVMAKEKTLYLQGQGWQVYKYPYKLDDIPDNSVELNITKLGKKRKSKKGSGKETNETIDILFPGKDNEKISAKDKSKSIYSITKF